MDDKLSSMLSWCQEQRSRQLELLKTLATIPAPSHQERLRAEYIAQWFRNRGADAVYIDEASNVVLPFGCQGRRDIRLVMAHMDVVFPDTTPLPVSEAEGMLYAPGVGDDTANVVALMLCAEYFLTRQAPDYPLLIVFNSCEEGLGNLKGVKQIMADYSGRIREMVSFDCQSNAVIHRAVGSERWQITVSTKGGHSFSDFGSPNAIAHLSRLVTRLYEQQVPQKDDCKTTYNVGLISGGTSVNTIAQNAELTYEYRSDDRDCLAQMRQQFQTILQEAACPGVFIGVSSIGIRPCGGDVPAELQEELSRRCQQAITSVYDTVPPLCAASTDANIPLSEGIPAATFGLYRGGGAHTREEYVEVNSLLPGLKIAAHFLSHWVD